MAKYVLHPGYVVSLFDGDEHYIGYGGLLRLYGLNPMDCRIADARDKFPRRKTDEIHLYPRSDGDYSA